ncbi:MAG: DUF4065 domain-containing protein [Gammaproteobacteria bacterium]|jgi:uncharacterized phage-associated protein
MMSCHDVAKYFLSLTDEDSGDLISNLKLQKLMYYAQGFCLAIYDEPLFAEPIVAWTHGPVVPEIYHAYKQYGADAIPPDENFDIDSIPREARELLDEVYSAYGQFSAWKLRNMTHEEAPWKDAVEDNDEIPHDSLSRYFKTLLA